MTRLTIEAAREHVGAGVVYLPTKEDGVITSVNDSYVFVRYSTQHPGAGGQATNPGDLVLLAPEAKP